MQKQWLLPILIFLLNCLFSGEANTISLNYTSDLLRLAKAAQIKAYLNEEKQPCNSFYKFACGKWSRSNPATASVRKTSYLQQLQDLYVRKSAELLKTEERKLQSNADVLLKNFYESCRDSAAIKQIGLEPVLRAVNFRGGWPKVSSTSWYEYEFDWLKVIAELRRKLGVDVIVGLEITPDFEDRDTQRIKVGAPHFSLSSKAAYLDDDYEDEREQYKQHISNTLQRNFAAQTQEWADEVAQQVLQLEQQLAKGLPDNDKLTLLQTTRKRYPAELKQAYGNFVDLSRYLQIIFNDTIYTQVYETPEDYMSNLVEVIQHTPKLTIANYTMWRVLEKFDLDTELRREQKDLLCVQKLQDLFPHQLESMFHRHYNTMQMINELNSLWADIKKAFRDELQLTTQLNWISLDTRQKAVLKLDAMELDIVTHNDAGLEEQMFGLILRKDKYYQNLINVLNWQTRQQLAQLIQKPQVPTADVQMPSYQLSTNRIRIPITFLQTRFFWDAAYPTSLKYSSLGVLLAQQMLHGFDALGRKFDKNGHQQTWWDASSQHAFDESAKCFSNQYAEYKYEGKHLPTDDSILRTVLADNGGLAIAYRAYRKWWQNIASNEVSNHETLPLLSYTQNQLFFINYAQLWCADYYKFHEQGLNELPERVRVTGALSNSNDFAHEFKCENDSKLNPQRKCTIY